MTVNATIAGPNISLTLSFIGAQPASYTDAAGKTVRPLGDIEDEAFDSYPVNNSERMKTDDFSPTQANEEAV